MQSKISLPAVNGTGGHGKLRFQIETAAEQWGAVKLVLNMLVTVHEFGSCKTSASARRSWRTMRWPAMRSWWPSRARSARRPAARCSGRPAAPPSWPASTLRCAAGSFLTPCVGFLHATVQRIKEVDWRHRAWWFACSVPGLHTCCFVQRIPSGRACMEACPSVQSMCARPHACNIQVFTSANALPVKFSGHGCVLCQMQAAAARNILGVRQWFV